jgi:hypothetical protein
VQIGGGPSHALLAQQHRTTHQQRRGYVKPLLLTRRHSALNPRHVYREAVAQPSPGSRSAPWDRCCPQVWPTLKGFDKAGLTLSNPYRVVKEVYLSLSPRVHCATLGCVVQPLRGKNEEERITVVVVIRAHSLTTVLRPWNQGSTEKR